MNNVELRDYFASKAMLAVMQETQEVRIGTFWDWIKQLLVNYLHFTFLTVKYVKIDGVYEEASKRAYEYADAMIAAKNQKIDLNKLEAKLDDALLNETKESLTDFIVSKRNNNKQ